MWSAPREDHNRLFIALLVGLVAFAWLTLWVSGQSSHGWLHNHGLYAFGGGVALMAVFIAGWTVMVVAMMLPTSLPLITLFRTLTRQRPDRARLTALLVFGYLVVWALFGLVIYLGGWVLHRLVEQSAWLEANGWLLGAGILTFAGLYQFTPLKYHCLEKCRSPLSFVMEHWRGKREASHAFLLGAHHGLFCVGCCWSLMLLMFLVGGVGSLGWMLVLGGVMAVEKNVSWGRRISTPLGVLLVVAGLSLGAAQALQPFGGASTSIPLTAVGNSGVSGSVALTDTNGGAEITLNVRGLPEPEATYLAHIHPGSCTGETAGGHKDHAHHDGADHAPEEIEHPLSPILSNARGQGTSTTLVRDATVGELRSSDPGFYVNVHAEASGARELPDNIACGDLSGYG